MTVSLICTIILTVAAFVGLVYLWDHYICDHMRKLTIIILSVVTAIVITGFVWLYIFVCSSFVDCARFEIDPNADSKTMTVTEYNVFGESRVLEDIKMPKDTKGVILDRDYEISRRSNDRIQLKIRLADGRLLWHIDDVHKVGNGVNVTMHEEYYPKYKYTILY